MTYQTAHAHSELY